MLNDSYIKPNFSKCAKISKQHRYLDKIKDENNLFVHGLFEKQPLIYFSDYKNDYSYHQYLTKLREKVK